MSFVVCRFDISYHHAFQHPMPTLRAAWVAVPFALVVAILAKARDSLKLQGLSTQQPDGTMSAMAMFRQ